MGTSATLVHTTDMANIGGGKQKKVQSSEMGKNPGQQSHSKWHTSFRADFKGSLVSLMIYCAFFESLKNSYDIILCL